MSSFTTHPVRPELVEGLSFFLAVTPEKKVQGFDKLSPNGIR